MSVERTPLLDSKGSMNIPPAPFATAISAGSEFTTSIRLPQAIAHRGYKEAFPENTLRAFTAAVDIGAHALETDIHLSRDNVVVLAHDGSLLRCFGEKAKIADCDWSYLSELETVREPKQHMPRLMDLLAYLALPENENIWLLLDIKADDDGDELLSSTATAIASVKPTRPWKDRIVMGAWSEHYVNLCKKHLPGFPIAFIGWDVSTAHKLLRTQPNLNFNLLQRILVGRGGGRFIKAAKKAGRNLWVWTVNTEEWMDWSIRKQVDGVITDDPKLFLEVCEKWRQGRGEMSTTWRQSCKETVMEVFWIMMKPVLWYFQRRRGRPKVPVAV